MVEILQYKIIMLKLLALCLLSSLMYVQTAEARIRRSKWEVKYDYKSPDCCEKLVFTINGRSPGPTILAQQGDAVIVEVKNSLMIENLAIHWHGIRQIGTPGMDGTEGVTQCPIRPGDTFKYEFKVDRPGTYLYHAHYGMHREAGLYGSIRISLPDGETEPFAYDYDRSIILNDWYHKSTYEQATGLSSVPFVWVGEPQSLLIQGRGKFNCSSTPSGPGVCNASNPECSPYVMTVIPGKTYRLRVSSLTALSALSFQIEGHNMTVVEADGHYVEPFVVDNLFIYSGETYSVLIKSDQDPERNYWMTTNVVSREPNTTDGLAILNYYPNHPRRSPPTAPPAGPMWNDPTARLAQSQAIKARQDSISKSTPPATSNRTIVFLNTQNLVNGYTKWAVNNISFTLPHTPYLVAEKNNLRHAYNQSPPPTGYDFEDYNTYDVPANTNASSRNGIYRLEFNTTVDIILQNAVSGKTSETHPWHLHGHDFWVLGYGTGKFDINEDPKKYNLVNPIMKNTVPVHLYGWTALRFKADNPGVWLFRCHIESHFHMGMGVVFEVGIEKVENLPSSIMGCG